METETYYDVNISKRGEKEKGGLATIAKKRERPIDRSTWEKRGLEENDRQTATVATTAVSERALPCWTRVIDLQAERYKKVGTYSQ